MLQRDPPSTMLDLCLALRICQAHRGRTPASLNGCSLSPMPCNLQMPMPLPSSSPLCGETGDAPCSEMGEDWGPDWGFRIRRSETQMPTAGSAFRTRTAPAFGSSQRCKRRLRLRRSRTSAETVHGARLGHGIASVSAPGLQGRGMMADRRNRRHASHFPAVPSRSERHSFPSLLGKLPEPVHPRARANERHCGSQLEELGKRLGVRTS